MLLLSPIQPLYHTRRSVPLAISTHIRCCRQQARPGPQSSSRYEIGVVGFREHDGEGGIVVPFENGTEVKADLVLGANRLRSVVKNSLFNRNYEAECESEASFSENFITYSPPNSGLTGVGSFLPVYFS